MRNGFGLLVGVGVVLALLAGGVFAGSPEKTRAYTESQICNLVDKAPIVLAQWKDAHPGAFNLSACAMFKSAHTRYELLGNRLPQKDESGNIIEVWVVGEELVPLETGSDPCCLCITFHTKELPAPRIRVAVDH